jgi:glycogen(starch) synthase
MTAELAAAMVRRGHSVTVITGNDRDRLPARETVDGVDIVRLPFRQAVLGHDAASFGLILAQARPHIEAADVVHVQNVSPSTMAFTMLRPTAPVIVTLHGEIPGNWDLRPGSAVRRLFNQARQLIGVSQVVVRGLLRLLPEATQRVVLVRNALPPLPICADQQEAANVTCLGRLSPEKGFDLAIRALPLIRREVPAARLNIIGDGNARSELESLSAELAQGGVVTFHGAATRDAVFRHLQRATVVLVPSRAEAFGLTALEAACTGRVVVATDVGGLSEVVLEGVTGHLVPVDNPEAIASAVVALLRDAAKRGTMEQNALALREGVSADFERSLALHDDIYQRAVAGAPPLAIAN